MKAAAHHGSIYPIAPNRVVVVVPLTRVHIKDCFEIQFCGPQHTYVLCAVLIGPYDFEYHKQRRTP